MSEETVAGPTLAEALTMLKVARDVAESIQANKAHAEEVLHSTQEWVTLESHAGALKNARSLVAVNEDRVRVLALEEYAETGDKHHTPGVNIRDEVELMYDVGDLTLWVRQNMPALLVLDVKAFEAYIRASKGRHTVPAAILQVAKVPAAVIDKKLP